MEYSEYIKTDHWKKLAEETKRLAGYRCQVCNSDGELHAHHRTYERKGDELQSDLVCLCKGCHSLYHDKETLPALGIDLDVLKSSTIFYLRTNIEGMMGVLKYHENDNDFDKEGYIKYMLESFKSILDGHYDRLKILVGR